MARGRRGRAGVRCAVAFSLCAACPAALGAQEALPYRLAEPATQVLTLSATRLFTDSAFAARVEAAVEARAEALSAENARIEAELSARERELTAARTTLSPTDFRAQADAFDQRAQAMRERQDGKLRELGQMREAGQELFVARIGPAMEQLMRESGAALIVEQSAVFARLEALDVTQEAIAAADLALGDFGADPEALADLLGGPQIAPVPAGASAPTQPALPTLISPGMDAQ